MQLFCEECGAKLAPGVRFCEECGAKIEDAQTKDSGSGASVSAASAESVAAHSGEITSRGIIYTDIQKISGNMDASESDVSEILNNFISSSRSRGVEYSLCQSVSSKNVGDHVSAIKSAAASHNVQYVFIIGGWDVVPEIIWENPADDSDEEVPSDLPYSVLSTNSPTSGVKYDFDSALRVGRLPIYNGKDIETFRSYLENVNLYSGKFSSHITFGDSALQWKLTSENVYSPFKNGGLVCSPDFTYESVDDKIPENANLLFFNLHGSEQTEYWYGQDGGDYPQAFSPQNMKNLVTPNFVGVEACYGAKYNGCDSDESIVLAALENKCLGLFGSSKIAFGVPGYEGMSCADIIVGEFLNNIKCGMASGDAAVEARRTFWAQAEDDSDMKTMMEFDLYGDPTAKMKPKSEKSFSSKSFGIQKIAGTAKISSLPSLRITMPDITRAIRTSLARTNDKINEQVNRYVWDAFKDMDGVMPKTYSVQCGMKTRYKNVYGKADSKFNKSIIAYFEPSGKITKVIGTK